MLDIPPTPPATLRRARAIAKQVGLTHVYTGNVRDVDGDTTYCGGCGEALIVRDWYALLEYKLDGQVDGQLDGQARCPSCATPLAGRFDPASGDPERDLGKQWGRRRMRVVV